MMGLPSTNSMQVPKLSPRNLAIMHKGFYRGWLYANLVGNLYLSNYNTELWLGSFTAITLNARVAESFIRTLN
jgi:hypothetical protein